MQLRRALENPNIRVSCTATLKELARLRERVCKPNWEVEQVCRSSLVHLNSILTAPKARFSFPRRMFNEIYAKVVGLMERNACVLDLFRIGKSLKAGKRENAGRRPTF